MSLISLVRTLEGFISFIVFWAVWVVRFLVGTEEDIKGKTDKLTILSGEFVSSLLICNVRNLTYLSSIFPKLSDSKCVLN